jgi:hypothetical protein
MDKSVMLADMGIAVLATLSFVIGLQIDGLFSHAMVALGGVLLGYLMTVYLNMEVEND